MVLFLSCLVGFWGFHPYMCLFSLRKLFCDFICWLATASGYCELSAYNFTECWLVLRYALPSMQWVGMLTTYDPPESDKKQQIAALFQPIRRVIHSSLQLNQFYLLPLWIWCCRSVKQTICFLSQSEWPYCGSCGSCAYVINYMWEFP